MGIDRIPRYGAVYFSVVDSSATISKPNVSMIISDSYADTGISPFARGSRPPLQPFYVQQDA